MTRVYAPGLVLAAWSLVVIVGLSPAASVVSLVVGEIVACRIYLREVRRRWRL